MIDLADAALVRVAERARIRRLFTTDTCHFHIYRPEALGSFELLLGEGALGKTAVRVGVEAPVFSIVLLRAPSKHLDITEHEEKTHAKRVHRGHQA